MKMLGKMIPDDNDDWLGSLNKTYTDTDIESIQYYKEEGVTGDIGGVDPVVRAMSTFGLIDYDDEQFLFSSIFALKQFAMRNILANCADAQYSYHRLFDMAGKEVSQVADFLIRHKHGDTRTELIPEELSGNFTSTVLKTEHFNNIFEQFKSITPRNELRKLVLKAERIAKQMSDEVFNSNLKLVYSIAKKHQQSHINSFEDYMQQGHIGLLTAIEKFNYTKGHKFSTYAYYWIEQEAGALYHKASTAIELPTYLNSRKTKLYNIILHAQNNQINITLDYLFEELIKIESEKEDLSPNDLESIRKSIPLILGVLSPTLSLHTEYAGEQDGTDVTLENMLEDPNQDTFEEVARKTMSEKMKKIMENNLKERELQVVRMYYGIGLNSEHSLKNIAEMLGITRARTWQILSKAIGTLRKLSADFIEFEIPDRPKD